MTVEKITNITTQDMGERKIWVKEKSLRYDCSFIFSVALVDFDGKAE